MDEVARMLSSVSLAEARSAGLLLLGAGLDTLAVGFGLLLHSPFLVIQSRISSRLGEPVASIRFVGEEAPELNADLSGDTAPSSGCDNLTGLSGGRNSRRSGDALGKPSVFAFGDTLMRPVVSSLGR